MRDRGPETEQMAALPDPLWEALGPAAPRRADPAFKARLRARLLGHPLPTAGGGGLGRQQRWLVGLGLLLILALLFWPRAAEGPSLPLPAAQPPTVAADPRPAGDDQPLDAPTQAPAPPASPSATVDRTGGQRPAVGRPAPGPARATAALATAAAPAQGSDEDEPRPQVQPTLETIATATATEALPDEPPTATAEPPADFPTRTPEAGTAGPPGP